MRWERSLTESMSMVRPGERSADLLLRRQVRELGPQD